MALIDRDIVVDYNVFPCVLLVDVEEINAIRVYLLILEDVVEETRSTLKGIQNTDEGVRSIAVDCSSYL